MKEKVQEALNKVRPQLQADGGDVELVEVTEGGLVKVRLTGACKGCPMSQMTLKMGIEKFLKTAGPGSDGGGGGLKAGTGRQVDHPVPGFISGVCFSDPLLQFQNTPFGWKVTNLKG